MNRIKWVKKNNREIETNGLPASIAAAMAAGWTRADAGMPTEDASTSTAENVPTVDARGLPWDERINTRNKSRDDAGNWKYKQGVTSDISAAVEQELALAAINGEG